MVNIDTNTTGGRAFVIVAGCWVFFGGTFLASLYVPYMEWFVIGSLVSVFSWMVVRAWLRDFTDLRG